MTFEEFENKFKRHVRYDKYYYHGLCYFTIAIGLFTFIALIKNNSSNKALYCLVVVLLTFGIYGLFILRKKYKVTIWENKFKKDKNLELLEFAWTVLVKSTIEQTDNYVYFIYRRSWWRMPYKIHLFADENFIAINVEGQDNYDGGFLDFGASKRTQTKILKLLADKASR